jgi:hypothetical protein
VDEERHRRVHRGQVEARPQRKRHALTDAFAGTGDD